MRYVNPVTPPRGEGEGLRDPESKVVGNLMKCKDIILKLTYGAGKCLKIEKNQNHRKFSKPHRLAILQPANGG